MKSFPFISELYDKVGRVEMLKHRASMSDFARAEFTINSLRRISSKLMKGSAQRILEIGPGSGFITEYLFEFIKTYSLHAKVDLCDISYSFLNTCGNVLHEVNKSFLVDICSMNDCDLYTEKMYDIILFQEALEHTTSPFAAIYNINRLLAEEGKLILTVPNTLHARRLLAELNPARKLIGSRLDTHIAEMTPLSILKLLTMAGFEVEDICYYASRYKFAKRLTSSQVGFICVKRRNPCEAWDELASKILSTWV